MDHVEVTEEAVATAEVTAVDRMDRMLTLAREDGSKLVVAAGPEVRNFDQIAVGDTLRIRYRECLVASLRAPDAAARPAEEAVAVGRSEPGAKPAGAIGHAISVPVKIQSIDLAKFLVVFTLPDGELRAAPVRTPQGREFLKGLKPGDSVQIDYTESLAIAVEKL